MSLRHKWRWRVLECVSCNQSQPEMWKAYPALGILFQCAPLEHVCFERLTSNWQIGILYDPSPLLEGAWTECRIAGATVCLTGRIGVLMFRWCRFKIFFIFTVHFNLYKFNVLLIVYYIIMSLTKWVINNKYQSLQNSCIYRIMIIS